MLEAWIEYPIFALPANIPAGSIQEKVTLRFRSSILSFTFLFHQKISRYVIMYVVSNSLIVPLMFIARIQTESLTFSHTRSS